MRTLRIGTRSSPLALAQTALVVSHLEHAGATVDVVHITTTGDTDRRPFSQIGGRGVFATEIEAALLAGSIDLAVHSCKDLPLEPDDRLVLAAVLEREDPRDAICGPAANLHELPLGATVATSSVRRTAALARLRSDLVAVPIRGNVGTRLTRSAELGHHGCMLAAAGLRRLGLADEIGFTLEPSQFVPEAGQGAVVVQARARESHEDLLEGLHHAPTARAVHIERAAAAALGGGCDTPVGVHVDTESQTAWVFVARADEDSRLEAVAAPAGGDDAAWVDALVHAVGRPAEAAS